MRRIYFGDFKVQHSRFIVQGSTFKVHRSRFNIQGSMIKVQRSIFKVQGSTFNVQGSSFKVQHSTFKNQCSRFKNFNRDPGEKNTTRSFLKKGLMAIFVIHSFIFFFLSRFWIFRIIALIYSTPNPIRTWIFKDKPIVIFFFGVFTIHSVNQEFLHNLPIVLYIRES